jgi:uncharacterized membrane protein
MSENLNKDVKKSDIKKAIDVECNLAVIIGIGAMVGVAISPTTWVVIAVTVISSAALLKKRKKIAKLKEEEKRLELEENKYKDKK